MLALKCATCTVHVAWKDNFKKLDINEYFGGVIKVFFFIIFLVENYLQLAKDQYGYSVDQALGMLYYHNYDTTKAVTDLANFCPLKGFILVNSNYFHSTVPPFCMIYACN